MLLQTPHGNIVWDLITLLDTETISRITELGGLAAIVISYPHYYTTLHDWSATFPSTPIYIGAPDRFWLVSGNANVYLLTSLHTPILPGVTVVLSGGHFPGSLCLHWDSQLFIADTILTVPSARNPVPGTPGSLSYTFWYSVPNRIPLAPSEIWGVWESVRGLEWHSTFGAFMGMDGRTTEEEMRRGTGGGGRGVVGECEDFCEGDGVGGGREGEGVGGG
jgi:glyoxylase-like metal-dependent hydrolase (beta-lactamase superfamily II)